MEGLEMRPRLTLSEHISAIGSSNHLRDLLKVREEEDGVRQSRSSLTLGSALASEKREAIAAGASSSRTLMDIIRDEAEMSGGGFPNESNSGIGVSLKDRLRLRRAGDTSADSSGHPNGNDLVMPLSTSPVLTVPVPRATPGQGSIGSEYNPSAVAAAAATGGGIGAIEEVEEQPVRVSLMALLEQTDRYGGMLTAAAEEETEVEVEVEGGEGGGEMCCVCMVRNKGAAFIPCGHAFCRLCSRELWVSRGSCPLCNGYILEILDIF